MAPTVFAEQRAVVDDGYPERRDVLEVVDEGVLLKQR